MKKGRKKGARRRETQSADANKNMWSGLSLCAWFTLANMINGVENIGALWKMQDFQRPKKPRLFED
jgi:hypothetical protein